MTQYGRQHPGPDGRDQVSPEMLRAALTRADFLKRTAGVTAGLGMSGLMAGCFDDDDAASGGATGAGVKRGGILDFVFTDGNVKDDLDPTHSISGMSVILNGMLFESLVEADLAWKVGPGLAEEWEPNRDATRWTFRLRQGVEFHNGKPLTAADVAYSIGRHLDEKTGSTLYAQLSESMTKKGIRAVDDLTLRIDLIKPNAFLPNTLALRHAQIIPEGADIAKGVGTGPFKMKSFAPARSFELERHANYWQSGKPYLDGVQGKFVSEPGTKVQAVISGPSHLTDQIDFTTLPVARASDAVEVLRLPNNLFYAIAFDYREATYKDPRVSQAFKYAIDRDAIVETVFDKLGTATSDVPTVPDNPLFPPSLGGVREYDPERAKSLLAQAGHGDGMTIELLTSKAGPGMVELAVLYKEQAAKAGIKLNLKQWPADTYWTEVWGVKPAFVGWWAVRHPYDNFALGYQTGSSWNEAHYTNKSVDQLIAKASATTDKAAQTTLLQELGALVADDAPKVIPTFVDGLFVAKKRLKGVKFDYVRHVDLREAQLT